MHEFSIGQLFQQMNAEHRGRTSSGDTSSIGLGDSLGDELNQKLQFSFIELNRDHPAMMRLDSSK